jgi:phage protein D
VTEWRIVTTERAVPTTVEARVYDVTQAKEEVVTASKPLSLPAKAQQYAGAFAEATQKYGLEPGLIEGLAKTESSFNPQANSGKALGLMQFTPGTASRYGLTNRLDPYASIDAAGRYLRDLYAEFKDWDLALAGYNAGEGAVRKYGGIPPFRETIGHGKRAREAQKAYTSGTGPTVRLRTTFQDPALAQTAVDSKVAAIARQAYTLTLTRPGRPTLAAETPLELSGFAPEVDGRWIITEASHHLDARGYVTALQAQRAAS